VTPQLTDPVVAAVHTAITTYTNQLRLDPGFVPLLLVKLWVDLALHHHAVAQKQGSSAHSGYARTAVANVLALASSRTWRS
jgi:hypothetical protein